MVLTSRAGTKPSLRAAFSLWVSTLNLWVAFSLRALTLRLVSEPRALSLIPSECSYTVNDCCTLSWLHRER